MTASKWLVLCGALFFAATADAQVDWARTQVHEDILVTHVPFGLGGTRMDWAHGYGFTFYDVVNTSSSRGHEVSFEYGDRYRVPAFLLRAGETRRVVLPWLPLYNSDDNVVPHVDGRPQKDKHGWIITAARVATQYGGYRSDENRYVLLSPGISGNAVRYSLDKLNAVERPQRVKLEAELSQFKRDDPKRRELQEALDKLRELKGEFLNAGMPLAEWPENWLAYTRFDALMMTEEDFNALPGAVARAVDRYVSGGGVLAIAGRAGEIETRGLGSVCRLASAVAEEWGAEEVRAVLLEADARARLWSAPNWSDGLKKALSISGATLLVVYIVLLVVTLVMGPVMLWVLARREKRIHLYWLAPTAAGLTSVGVLAAAFYIDGVTPFVRTNATMVIDAKNGTAVTWSQVAIKAPMAVRGGLVFAADTEVTPLESRRGRNSKKRVEWADAQRFSPAWLPPRIPVSFLLRTVGPAPEMTLEIVSESDAGLVVANRSHLPLARVYARGAGATHYLCEGIPAGGTATLAPLDFRFKFEETPVGARELALSVSFPASLLPPPLDAPAKTEPPRKLKVPRNIELSAEFKPGKPLPMRSFVVALEGTPFTEKFISAKTKSSGTTLVHGAFATEGQP